MNAYSLLLSIESMVYYLFIYLVERRDIFPPFKPIKHVDTRHLLHCYVNSFTNCKRMFTYFYHLKLITYLSVIDFY